jgi:chemotaxis protein MotB
LKETGVYIIKKSKRRRWEEMPHGGAWKVAYADFVTAMMTLFIVLWIVAHNQNVRSTVAQYFRNPNGVMTGTNGVLDGGTGVLPTYAPGSSAAEAVEAGQSGQQAMGSDVETLRLEGENLAHTINTSPNFSKFQNQVEITLTKDGLRIDLIEQSSGLFFEIGSARMTGDAVELLKLIGGRIGSLQNPVIIEGHTDSRPYAGSGYDNWDLSTDRANAARRVLEQAGIDPQRIIGVNGYADRRLKKPDQPLDFSNRRVTILVTFSPIPAGVAKG